MAYEFYSEGPQGRIKKVVQYTQLKNSGENYFNLGFGDWDEINQEVNDKVVSNNNDRQKILATVAATILEFVKHYPDAIVIVAGSTPSRTRLYQIAIKEYFLEINENFELQGFREGGWEVFNKNHNKYQAFSVTSRKKT